MPSANAAVAAAYGEAGGAWLRGPMPVYAALAEAVCARLDGVGQGALVLDVGSGPGAATGTLSRRGAAVVCLDLAIGMLARRTDRSRPAVAADALELPFRARSFDGVIAAFSFNHLDDPVAGLVEARRVLRPGGAAVVAVYAESDAHPAKAAVEAAAAAAGWSPPGWYAGLLRHAMPLLATVERAAAAAAAAGVPDASVERLAVPVPGVGVDGLLAWRAGMPHLAPFFSSLSPDAQDRVLADARARLGDDVPPLVRSIVLLRWREPVAQP